MPDQPTFVVNDRRKFTAEGELRHEPASSEPSPTSSSAGTPSTSSPSPVEPRGPQLVGDQPSGQTPAGITAELADLPESDAVGDLYPSAAEAPFTADAVDTETDLDTFPDDASLPPGPTAEQAEEATRAYDATVERLDTAMRATNPGADRVPPMSFERLVQSLYTQALILLGGGTEPGQTPRVDLLGARDTIDMLAVLSAKSKGNLSSGEDKLLESALFDLRMGFLEITQALSRQAAQRQMGTNPGSAGPGGLPPNGGPRIVR